MRIKIIKFVWNADFSVSGGVNALKEVISGEHSCSLCAIAYHRIRQTNDWKRYKRELEKAYRCTIREPCRNQLSTSEAEYIGGIYPTVLAITDEGMRILLAGEDIENCDGDFDVFKKKLNQSLSGL